MTKTKNKLKITSLLLALTIIVSLFGIFSLTASAETADLTVTIDTGESVTLKDTDSDGYYDIGTADELYAFAAAVNGDDDILLNAELTADIVVNQNVLTDDGTPNGDDSNFRAWTPIGTYTDCYEDIFDGTGHTGSGL